MEANGQVPKSSPTCLRSAFLDALLEDQERGRNVALDEYLRRFPGIETFVRSEFNALAGESPNGADVDGPLPAAVGRYEIRRLLGEGGMGRVYEAFDPELRRRVVVKSLRASHQADHESQKRLLREARVLGQLANPHLTQVIDVVEADGRLHLVLAFHDGCTLGELVAAARAEDGTAAGRARRWLSVGPPAPGTDRVGGDGLGALVAYFASVARALASAHRAGVVHRDVKPHNLMVTRDGTPVVLDFGLAQLGGDDRLTAAGELLGTPLYMAPEQIEGRQVEARTDVYALGVTMYEALTLVHPFAGPGGQAAVFQRILRGNPLPPWRHRASLPRDLEAVVLRAMERVPAQRYGDMQALAADLQRVVDGEATEARPVSGFGVMWRRARRQPFVLATTVLMVGLAGWAMRAQWLLGETRTQQGTLRSAPASAVAMAPIHPRGRVLPPTAFAWVGLPTMEPGRSAIRFQYTYRIQVTQGDSTVCEDEVVWDKPGGAQRVEWRPATALAAGSYRWSVSLASFDIVPDQGHGPEGPEQVTLQDMQDEVGQIDAPFEVVPAIPDLPRQGAARLQELSRLNLWSDVLLEIDRLSASMDAHNVPSDMSPEQMAEYESHAALALEDQARVADVAVRQALSPKGAGR